jgi:hypothetical protein
MRLQEEWIKSQRYEKRIEELEGRIPAEIVHQDQQMQVDNPEPAATQRNKQGSKRRGKASDAQNPKRRRQNPCTHIHHPPFYYE